MTTIKVSPYYTEGYNAAWRGLTTDDMPKFKRQDRAALWLKGHADGLRSYTQHKELLQVNKPGLKTICDVMRDALAKSQGV